MGKANANVFPEPVFAAPIQSLPSKMAGIQFSCIGVACFKPLLVATRLNQFCFNIFHLIIKYLPNLVNCLASQGLKPNCIKGFVSFFNIFVKKFYKIHENFLNG